MIRLYLDWGVVSNLKTEAYQEIKDFIVKHKQSLLIPYSPTHFNDLMKSYSPDNNKFIKDVEMLDYLSERHLLMWEKEKNRTLPYDELPSDYFKRLNPDSDKELLDFDFNSVIEDFDKYGEEQGIKDLGTGIKNILQSMSAGVDLTKEHSQVMSKIFPGLTNKSTMWDVLQTGLPSLVSFGKDKNRYLDLRNTVKEKGFQLEPNAGNWNEKDVIKNIDSYLKENANGMDFYEYIESIFKNQNKEVNKYDFYNHAYFILDIIGYKSDKLKKPTDNLMNIANDSEHSFYAAYCDYFVVKDKGLSAKTKTLYHKLKINTKVITPEELIPTIEKVIHKNQKLNDEFISEIVSFFKEGTFIESFDVEDWAGDIYKLPILYFNYFNHMIHTKKPMLDGNSMTFKRVFGNYSDFTFYVEDERLINAIGDFFGDIKDDEFHRKVKSLVYDGKYEEIFWQSPNGAFKAMLSRDGETGRPWITYFFLNSSNKKE